MQSFSTAAVVIESWLAQGNAARRFELWQKLSATDKNTIWHYCEGSSPKDLESLWNSEWQAAKEYFASQEHKNQLKMSHKIGKTRHSFIQVDGEIYMLARKDKQLGEGAFGKVKPSYLRGGEGDVLNNKGEACIVKVIKTDDKQDEANVARETAALEKLGELRAKQERILPSGKKKIYLIAKRHSGKELFDVINTGELTEAQNLMIAYQCCQLVDQAHAKGLLHLDIKPENFVVDIQKDKITVALIDWGLSRPLSTKQSTVETALVGTPGYIAPEIIADAPVASTAADAFSLGVLLKNDLLLDANTCEALLRYDADKRESLTQMQQRLVKLMADLPDEQKDNQIIACINANKTATSHNESPHTTENKVPLTWQQSNIVATIENFKSLRLNILLNADDLWLIKAKAYGYILRDLETVKNRIDIDDDRKLDMLVDKLQAAERTYYGEIKTAVTKELATLQWERDYNRLYDSFEEKLKTLSESERQFFKQAIESIEQQLSDLSNNDDLSYEHKLQELSKILSIQLSIFESLSEMEPQYQSVCAALSTAMKLLPEQPVDKMDSVDESLLSVMEQPLSPLNAGIANALQTATKQISSATTSVHDVLESALAELDKIAEELAREKEHQPQKPLLQDNEIKEIGIINQLLAQCAMLDQEAKKGPKGKINEHTLLPLKIELYHPQIIPKLQKLLSAQQHAISALRQRQVNKNIEIQLRQQIKLEEDKIALLRTTQQQAVSQLANVAEAAVLQKIVHARRPLTLLQDRDVEPEPAPTQSLPVTSQSLTQQNWPAIFAQLQAKAQEEVPINSEVMRSEVALQTAIAEVQLNTQSREGVMAAAKSASTTSYEAEDKAISKTVQAYQQTIDEIQTQLDLTPPVEIAGVTQQLKEVVAQRIALVKNHQQRKEESKILSDVLTQAQQSRRHAITKLQQINDRLHAICQSPVDAYELKQKQPERLFDRKWLKHQTKNAGRRVYGKEHTRKKQLKMIQDVLLALNNEFTAQDVPQLKEKAILAYQCLAQIQKQILEENNRIPSTLFKVCETQMQALETILQELQALEKTVIAKPLLTEEQFLKAVFYKDKGPIDKERAFEQRFVALCQQYKDTPFDSSTLGAGGTLNRLETRIQRERDTLQYFAQSGGEVAKVEAIKLLARLDHHPVVNLFDSKVAERAKMVEKRHKVSDKKVASVTHSPKQQQALISQKVTMLQEKYLGKVPETPRAHRPKNT